MLQHMSTSSIINQFEINKKFTSCQLRKLPPSNFDMARGFAMIISTITTKQQQQIAPIRHNKVTSSLCGSAFGVMFLQGETKIQAGMTVF